MFDLLFSRADIAVRPTIRADLEGVARVSVDTWRTTYKGLLPEPVLQRLRYGHQQDRHGRFLDEPQTLHFVAVEPETGEVVGFVNGGAARQASLGYQGEIYELYVQNGFQRRGVGRALFDAVSIALTDRGRKGLVVWVLATNPNRPFYEAMGGRVVSRQPVRMGGFMLQEAAYAWEDGGL